MRYLSTIIVLPGRQGTIAHFIKYTKEPIAMRTLTTKEYLTVQTFGYRDKQTAIERRRDVLDAGFPASNLFVQSEYDHPEYGHVVVWAFKVGVGRYNNKE